MKVIRFKWFGQIKQKDINTLGDDVAELTNEVITKVELDQRKIRLGCETSRTCIGDDLE